ncbi:MAG: hypothetical protein QXP36_13210, partial [Conexivisphaerales archaeon]
NEKYLALRMPFSLNALGSTSSFVRLSILFFQESKLRGSHIRPESLTTSWRDVEFEAKTVAPHD